MQRACYYLALQMFFDYSVFRNRFGRVEHWVVRISCSISFPLCVTSGICFGILCSKYSFSETVAIILCVIWSAVWLFVVLNENVYTMVTIPVWLALLGATILFLILTVCRILKNCNQYLEVSLDEIRT